MAVHLADEGTPRQRWGSPLEFTITCIGYAVGLGNFWRFPYLCYTYGGGAFLLPYTIVLFTLGMPIFCMELGIGQKYQIGATHAWTKIHPAFSGIGLAGVMATFFVALYYNVIVGWALWFLANSGANPLPWANRANETDGALRFWEVDTLRCRGTMASCSWENVTDWGAAAAAGPSLFDTWGAVGSLVLCLAIGWFLIWLCVCKGIESLGKVAWVTAIFPYLVLVILLVRGLTLDGADIGLKFYLTPRFDQLGNIKVWIAAASQIFYSTGVGWGTLVAFASYNDTRHNFVRDAWLVPLINCGTSFLAGLVVFSVLGFMAKQADLTVEDLRLQGSGLAFVAYPSALAQMPAAQLFSVLFFLMIICLGVDSQFAMVETVLTALNDANVLPGLSKPKKSALVCTLMGLIGLVFVTRAGLHWLDLFDTFSVNVTLFIVGAFECIAVGWVYGADQFAADAERMTGRKLPRPLLWSITFVIPPVLVLLSLWALIASITAGYAFPPAGIVMGWILSLCSVFPLFFGLRKAASARTIYSSARARLKRICSGQASRTKMPREITPADADVVGASQVDARVAL